MASNGLDSPRFVINKEAHVGLEYGRAKREVIRFNSIAELSADLDDSKYYIPNSSIFPLLDAFTVDLHPWKRAILWVIQITTSRSHGGSALGYRKVCSIVASLKELLGKRPVKKMGDVQAYADPWATVRYLLVVSKGDSKHLEWRFPKGWNENVLIVAS